MSVLLQLPANITFEITCPHPKRIKYKKGHCCWGRAKIANWGGGRKRTGGDMSHQVYILKKALKFIIVISLSWMLSWTTCLKSRSYTDVFWLAIFWSHQQTLKMFQSLLIAGCMSQQSTEIVKVDQPIILTGWIFLNKCVNKIISHLAMRYTPNFETTLVIVSSSWLFTTTICLYNVKKPQAKIAQVATA